MDKKIQIIVNGLEERVLENSTVSNLIELFKEEDTHLIVEYNGQFLYPRHYGTTLVEDGDMIEFINPNFGG
jgi:thiamine biosynthesis protein ThiS